MGLIIKQSSFNFVFLIIGAVIAALNTVILIPFAFTDAQWGVYSTIPLIGFLAGNLALLGTGQILLKYVPQFGSKKIVSGGILRHSFILALVGVVIVGSILLITKPFFVDNFHERAKLLSENYFLLIPFMISVALSEFLSFYAKSLLKSTLAVFLKEIVYRILQTILILMYYFDVINFELLIIIYVNLLFFNFFILLIYLIYLRLVDFTHLDSSRKRAVNRYGLINFLTVFGGTITSRIDGIMLLSLLSVPVMFTTENYALEMTGTYLFGVYLVSISEMPARAVSSIVVSPLASLWESNKLDEIHSVYKKSALNQLFMGGLIYCLIMINIDDFLLVLGKHFEAKWVVFYIGLAKIIHIGSGANGAIIITSKYYRVGLIGVIIIMVLTIITNLLFIPSLGLIGAAMATLISLGLFNIFAIWFLYSKFKFLPYSFNTLKLILCLSVCSIPLFFITMVDGHPILNMLLKSSILVGVFAVLSIKLKLSDEVITIVNSMKSKISNIKKDA